MPSTAAEVFTEIDGRIKTGSDKFSSDVTYLFNLTGEGSGEYHVMVGPTGGEAGPGGIENPTTTVTADAGDFLNIATGKLDPTMAFMTGKIKVGGNMGYAMKLQTILKG